jgi:hypothetical protein
MAFTDLPLTLPLAASPARRFALAPDIGAGQDWLEIQLLSRAEDIAIRAWLAGQPHQTEPHRLTPGGQADSYPMVAGAELLAAMATRRFADSQARLSAMAGAMALVALDADLTDPAALANFVAATLTTFARLRDDLAMLDDTETDENDFEGDDADVGGEFAA